MPLQQGAFIAVCLSMLQPHVSICSGLTLLASVSVGQRAAMQYTQVNLEIRSVLSTPVMYHAKVC